MVLDIAGTVVVINANLWPESSAADRDEFADVLDSIRIDPRPLQDGPGGELAPGTYFVDEVDGTPTARIYVTIGTGWTTQGAWADLWKDGALKSPVGDVGLITFSRPDRGVLGRLPLERWVPPGACDDTRRPRHRAHGATRMGRRDCGIGHLHRRLCRQDVPARCARRAVELPQLFPWAHERSRA